MRSLADMRCLSRGPGRPHRAGPFASRRRKRSNRAAVRVWVRTPSKSTGHNPTGPDQIGREPLSLFAPVSGGTACSHDCQRRDEQSI